MIGVILARIATEKDAPSGALAGASGSVSSGARFARRLKVLEVVGMDKKEYIERGALLKEFEELARLIIHYGERDRVLDAIQRIKNAPAADVVEVRHGAYVYDDNKFPIVKCSVCGLTRNCETEHGWNYCSYCGARMDGERKEQT